MARRHWGKKTCPHCGKPGIWRLEKHYPEYCSAARAVAPGPRPAAAPLPPPPLRPLAPAAPTAPPVKEPPLTREQEALVLSHQRLVGRIAKGFGWTGLPKDELFQQGMPGLVRAARAYDPARGVAFPTFAYRQIQGEMAQLHRLIGGPVAVSTSQPARAVRALLRQAQSPDLDAIAAQVGVKRSYVEAVYARTGTRGDRVIDERLELADPGAVQAEDELGRVALLDQLRAGVPKLPSYKELEILRRRFFLDRPQSRASIGRRMNLSGQRVLLLEKRALARLKRFTKDEKE